MIWMPDLRRSVPADERVHIRLTTVVAILVALAMGLTGCAFGGDAMSRHQENLENQRKVAVDFVKWQGGVENIRFTDEGNRPGLGVPWSANAVVTIEGADYQMILGTRTTSGDPLPDIPPTTPAAATTVIFSDGSLEVIE